jgi:hypothetical protein
MTIRLEALLALGLLAVGAWVWAADTGQVRERIQQQKLVPGLSARDVRTAIGEPTRIRKTQTYWTTVEDWVYGEGKDAVLLTFEEGKLTKISGGSPPERR